MKKQTKRLSGEGGSPTQRGGWNWRDDIDAWNDSILIRYQNKSCVMCGLSKKGLVALCEKIEAQARAEGESAGREKERERMSKLLELALKKEKLSGMTLFKLNQIITNNKSK